MATLRNFFPALGSKRRLERAEEESLVSTDGDTSTSSLVEADSECSTTDDGQSRGRRKWQTSWQKQFPLLEKKVVGADQDYHVLAVCRWCREAGKSNAFARGSGNFRHHFCCDITPILSLLSAFDLLSTAFKTEMMSEVAFIRHETRNPDHTVIMFGRKAKVQGCTIDITISRQNELEANRAAEGDVTLEAQMRTMYSIVKSGQPLSQFNTLCELQTLNNTPGFQDQRRLYTSYCSHLDLLTAINATVEEKIDENLRESPFIGLVIDESTDVSVYKKLVMYARVVIKGHPAIHFLQDVNVIDGKAETIVRALEKFSQTKI